MLVRAVILAAALLALGPPATALAQDAVAGPPREAPFAETLPPPGFTVSANQAIEIADRTRAARDLRRRERRVVAKAWVYADRRWQVDYYVDGDLLVEVDVTAHGRVLATFTGPQAEWELARGHAGGVVDSPWVWAGLALLFLAPFFDPRRPRRLLHLDLLVLLAFGLSQLFFTRGDVYTSVPLVYPVLAYLLVRMLVVGMRGREGAGPLVPYVPTAVLAVALVLLVGGRVALNVANDRLVDVGYASVLGAQRIHQGEELYVRSDGHGDTYGPVMYLAYVPFERTLPFNSNLPAAHGAAIAFDLMTLVGVLLLGMRLRAGPEGRRLGLALAWAWAAYPYSMLALGVNTNDALVPALLVFSLLAVGGARTRGTLRSGVRGALLGLAVAAKFAPLALAPLLAAGQGERRPRALVVFAAALAAVIAVTVWPFLPPGGVSEFYDRTIGFQLGRDSPFSLWGLHSNWEWLQGVVKVAAAALAAAVYLIPRRRSLRQVVALAAAVVIAVQLSVPHWFYFYIVWFAPLVLAALFAGHETAKGRHPAEQTPAPTAERTPVAA